MSPPAISKELQPQQHFILFIQTIAELQLHKSPTYNIKQLQLPQKVRQRLKLPHGWVLKLSVMAPKNANSVRQRNYSAASLAVSTAPTAQAQTQLPSRFAETPTGPPPTPTITETAKISPTPPVHSPALLTLPPLSPMTPNLRNTSTPTHAHLQVAHVPSQREPPLSNAA
jgi:hypothetical protein